ncbi:RNA polymerase factor sigma-32 [Chelatococcus reniformis]|uniref:RNA polymerase factor sigma-32 n=1 Tax=Chelatococcus reniformis TaxID=1494448 RepID=A0A916TXB8_9HYPH|nr:RNA polymerase factor sigma-32 [Chelatococcus reniformis]GGC50528.1 RNA polymerase factor sigma-32 [Chelatococcus reniformis]
MGEIAGVARHVMHAATKAPYLEHDEERELALRWRDHRDDAALHRLTSAHLRLVLSVAARFRRYGLSASDLVQEGSVGLLEAALRFEPERNIRFSTYAAWWVRASMQDYVLRNWSIVRGGTSSSQKALFFNLRRVKARAERNGDSIGDAMYGDIATALKVSRRDVEAMDARLSGPDLSLNAPVAGPDQAEHMEFLVDGEPLPDERVGDTIDGERRLARLRQALSMLNERELKIVYERRLTEESTTLEALGQRLGISKERVRQIENRALAKLRAALCDWQPVAEAAYA